MQLMGLKSFHMPYISLFFVIFFLIRVKRQNYMESK